MGDGGSINATGGLNGGMTKDENRVHFGGWCIVSSPLILAYNLSEPARRELVWDIITNKEAIYVNQQWAGHPGSQKLEGIGSNKQVTEHTRSCGRRARPSIAYTWPCACIARPSRHTTPGDLTLTRAQVEVWTKPLGEGRTAVLLVNTADRNWVAPPASFCIYKETRLSPCVFTRSWEGELS